MTDQTNNVPVTGEDGDSFAPAMLDAARRQYDHEINNDPVVHTNRFPAWDELSEAERARRIIAAAALAQTGETT